MTARYHLHYHSPEGIPQRRSFHTRWRALAVALRVAHSSPSRVELVNRHCAVIWGRNVSREQAIGVMTDRGRLSSAASSRGLLAGGQA